MAELKGSRTERNLMEAFAGESQANRKYTYYAGAARKAGMNRIAEFFEETAINENAHAKLWFKLLHDGDIPALDVDLQDAADGERYEHTDMYPKFAATAKEEGFPKIAFLFEQVGKIEARHEARYLELLDFVKNDRVFKRDEPIAWICDNCGYIHIGTDAPQLCPVCMHPRAHFARFEQATL